MMATDHACSQCGAPIHSAPSAAGIPSLCADCGQVGADGTSGSAADQVLPPVRPKSARRNLLLVVLLAICALGALVIVAGILCFMSFPFTSMMLESSQRMQCAGNLAQISQALDAYKLKFGTLPPPFLADAQGRPAHSWRVLLLPSFGIDEYDALYQEYKFDEPWDGPHNGKLHARMPDVYGCPGDPDAFGQATSYLALTTATSTALGTSPVGLRSPNLDATAKLLIVEVNNSGIIWTEPRDLDVGQLPASVNHPSGQGIRSNHLDGAHVLQDDTEVRLLEMGDAGN